MQMYKRKFNTRYTPEFIADLQHHILNNCSHLVAVSPKSNDNVMVTDPITGIKTRQQKHLLTVSAQELHNELIKPVAQGGFAGARDDAKD